MTPASRIVDVGCGPLGLRAHGPELDVTGVDLAPRPDYPGPFVQADATERLPFADGAFDLAYSNSVIEHLPPARREAFARELMRVARGWWVQTPAFGFPIEPHSLLPAAHWLPPAARRRYWRLGVAGTDDVHLLRRRELVALFGAAGDPGAARPAHQELDRRPRARRLKRAVKPAAGRSRSPPGRRSAGLCPVPHIPAG